MKENIKIAKRVQNEGFANVLKTSNYSRNELLGLLHAMSKNNDISKESRRTIQKIIKENLSSHDLSCEYLGVLSYTHIGNRHANFEYIKRAYDTFSKYQITHVLHLGDLLDGYNDIINGKRNHPSFYYLKQLEELKKRYPHGFQNYVLFGNHEESYLKLGLDLEREIMKRRGDFHLLGFGRSYLSNTDQLLLLKHPLHFYKNILLPPIYEKHVLTLNGHSHSFDLNSYNQSIKVPTCSERYPNGCNHSSQLPGFLVLRFLDSEIIMKRYVFENHHPLEREVRTLNKQKQI